MNFTNPNTGCVWSWNAQDIILNDVIMSGPVQFTVFLNGSSVAAFSLNAYNSHIVLKFREILEAILPNPSLSFPSTTSSFTNTVYIRATQGSTSLNTSTMHCFRGGSDILHAFPQGNHWLTWKPQITDTYPWAKECLSFVKPASVSRTVYAKVYLSGNTSVIVTIGTFSSASGQISICSVNCSPSRISGYSAVSGRTVLAYDVYIEGFLAHRFILKSARLCGREFLFENSLGVLDTVFATGDVSRETDSAVASVLIDKVETETSNNAVERFKVSTGWIRDRRMMDQWQEFARSSDRYVMLQGDDIRRIVVDSFEPEMTEHRLSSATITYHYAQGFTGRFYDDLPIGAFNYSSID